MLPVLSAILLKLTPNPELTDAKRPVRNEMTNEVERVVMCKTEEKRSLPCTFCDCGNIDAQTLRMRKEASARQTAIELVTEGLDIDEHGYVI